MDNTETNYYDDKYNFLFVKKDEKGKLKDHIFIHIGDSNSLGFLAYFDSYDSEIPQKLFLLKEFGLTTINNTASDSCHSFELKENWGRTKVDGALPSNLEKYFKLIEEKLKCEK